MPLPIREGMLNAVRPEYPLTPGGERSLPDAYHELTEDEPGLGEKESAPRARERLQEEVGTRQEFGWHVIVSLRKGSSGEGR